MKNKTFTKITLIVLLCFFLIGIISFAQAQNEESSKGIPWLGIEGACLQCGNCTICDIVNVGLNIGKFLIGIIGSIIFVYFIYGGIWLLISGGDANKIAKGKNIIINSVIGLAIIMFAYFFVFFIVFALTGGDINVENLVTPQLKCQPAPTCPGPTTQK